MFAIQYSHRLPADYDVQRIRDRAAQRGPLWDDAEGLVLKAFVATERGRHGAESNVYASVYLWADSAALARFLADGRFSSVIDSFGRPAIETWLPIQAHRGPAQSARTLYREEYEIAPSSKGIPDAIADIAPARDIVRRADTLATWTVLEPTTWRLIRFTLSADEPDPRHAGKHYEVLHLAKPGLAKLT